MLPRRGRQSVFGCSAARLNYTARPCISTSALSSLPSEAQQAPQLDRLPWRHRTSLNHHLCTSSSPLHSCVTLEDRIDVILLFAGWGCHRGHRLLRAGWHQAPAWRR